MEGGRRAALAATPDWNLRPVRWWIIYRDKIMNLLK
jgi:hypothetical protein